MTKPATLVQFPVTVALECPECGATGQGSCHCGVPYVPAGERAAKAIMETPGLSDRAIAEAVGVDRQVVRTARRKAGGLANPPEARRGKDGKLYRIPQTVEEPGLDCNSEEPAPRDRPIRLPPGSTVEQICREGLELEKTEPSKDAVAKQLGIERQSYRRLREIILLHDKAAELAAKDRTTVENAYRLMTATQSVKRPHAAIAQIAAKMWGSQNSRRDGKKAKARVERFMTFIHGTHARCEISGTTLEVPYLPRHEAEDAIAMIDEARAGLRALRKKLEEFIR